MKEYVEPTMKLVSLSSDVIRTSVNGEGFAQDGTWKGLKLL